MRTHRVVQAFDELLDLWGRLALKKVGMKNRSKFSNHKKYRKLLKPELGLKKRWRRVRRTSWTAPTWNTKTPAAITIVKQCNHNCQLMQSQLSSNAITIVNQCNHNCQSMQSQLSVNLKGCNHRLLVREKCSTSNN